MKTKTPVVPHNVFVCETCGNKEIDAKDIKDHLREVHKLTELKGRRETLVHMDGGDWYSWEFKWTIGDVVLYQSTLSARHKDDPMRCER